MLAEWAATAEGLTTSHRRKLLSQAIWWWTEADGKSATRYRTRSVVEHPGQAVQHEHVLTRKGLVDRMLSNAEAGPVLTEAVACLVTLEEHRLLSAIDNREGWDRYRAANIEVIDMDSGEPLALPTPPTGSSDEGSDPS